MKMEQNNNEINITDIVRKLITSLPLVIVITLVFTISSYYLASQKPINYKSVAFIEIGNMLNFNWSSGIGTMTTLALDASPIEPEEKLIKQLNFYSDNLNQFNSTGNFNFESLTRKMIEISHQSSSIENNNIFLDNVINFILNRHEIIQKNHNEYYLGKINYEIEILKKKIEQQEKTLILLKNNLPATMEMEFYFGSNRLTNQIIDFNAQLNTLENDLKLVTKKNIENKTRLIGEIKTQTIFINKKQSVIKGFIFGLSLSIFLIFIIGLLKTYKLINTK